MIICHAHKFIFFKTQRVAGSSMEAALSQICGEGDVLVRVGRVTDLGDQLETVHKFPEGRNYTIPMECRESSWRWRALLWKVRPIRNKVMIPRLEYSGTEYLSHMRARQVRETVPADVWNSYYKVSIERNPWDREASRYYYRRPNWSQKETFAQFLDHFKPIPNFDIYSIDGKVVVDQLMRYENLQEDFRTFLSTIGVTESVAIPRTNSSGRGTGDAIAACTTTRRARLWPNGTVAKSSTVDIRSSQHLGQHILTVNGVPLRDPLATTGRRGVLVRVSSVKR